MKMLSRCVQSGIILAGILAMLSVPSNKVEDVTYEYTFDTSFAGICAEMPEISELPVISANEVAEVAVEAPNSPELDTLTYELYMDMGVGEETFYDDLEALALICEAEAEGESEYGKRLVIDTVLNRMESEVWCDDTIMDVITHPGQYEAYWNGRYDAVEVNEETCQLVIEEMTERTNEDVIYFKTNGYHNDAAAIMQEGNHYFCGQY